MTNKKKSVHVKSSFKLLVVLIALIVILGLVFMNWMFMLIMLVGVLLILLISNWINKKKKKKWIRVLFTCLAIFFLISAIAGICGVAWFFKYVVDHSPEFDPEVLSMTQTTKIYDSTGLEIAELGTEKREIIEYKDLNEVLVDALIATEDSRFFQHNGFDAPRFLLASVKQAMGNSGAGGASTLTMQVAKNSYNKDSSTVTKGFAGIVRKFSDIYLAVFKIEKNYSKEEIIEFYINNHFLGNNSYGVEQGALTYFNKHASQLNLSEAALLIGLFQAPTAYNPYSKPENAAERRAEVLTLMYKHGYITKEEMEIANAIPISSLLTSTTEEQKYYSYLNTVVEEAINKYGVNPHTNSLLIYTNMNRNYQTILDDVMSGKTYRWLDDEVQAGVAVVDVHNGKILAIGGGRNQNGNRTYNFATDTKRQIGSSAKPLFDYAPGMEYKNWSTYTLFDDSKYYYSSGQEIRNSDRGYMGVITLRKALAQSRNIPALKAFQQNDNRQVYDFITSVGITPESDSVKTKTLFESYAIGSFNGSNPLTMAAAYAAFANGGYYYEPYTISKIIYRDTDEVIIYNSEKKKVMSDSTAYMITECLRSAVNDGLSGTAKVPGVNVAAKTGTSNYSSATLRAYGLPSSALNDAWIIGYNPDIAVGLWYGYEPISTKHWTTNDTAYSQRKGLWTATAGKIFARDGKDFVQPNSVVKVCVEMSDDVEAEPKLCSSYTPNDKKTYEWFKRGTEPTEESTRYQRLPEVTGLVVNYDANKKQVTLNWNPSPEPVDKILAYGRIGYRLYVDGAYKEWFYENSYTLNNVTNPNATYRVTTSYEHYGGLDSLGTIYKFVYDDPATYVCDLLIPTEKEYNVGDSLELYDSAPGVGDVKLTKDGEVVTPTVSISIVDENNQKIANISTYEPKTFTITYNVTYGVYQKTLKRTITVK